MQEEVKEEGEEERDEEEEEEAGGRRRKMRRRSRRIGTLLVPQEPAQPWHCPRPRAAFPPRHLNAKEMSLQSSVLMVLMRERG